MKETSASWTDNPDDMSLREYTVGPAFIIATDVSNEGISNTISDITPLEKAPLPEGKPRWLNEYEISPENFSRNPSGVGLYIASKPLFERLGKIKPPALYAEYGVNKDDLALVRQFSQGFVIADLGFTWHFAPGVANTVVETFEKEGYISPEERQGLTLTDWSNVIGSAWFGKLMHSLAFTANGLYREYGTRAEHYYESEAFRTDFIKTLNLNSEDPLFEVSKQIEPKEGRTYLTASPSPQFQKALSARMRAANSSGCPVARYATSLPPGVVETNPHVQRLLKNGTMYTVPERSNDEKILLRQDHSAIDHALITLADQLQAYDGTYGTPAIRPGLLQGTTLTHRYREATNVLRPKTEEH